MDFINGVKPVDGDKFLIENSSSQVSKSGTDFDRIYNELTAPDSLENIFAEASKKFGINENFLKAVAKAESGFDPEAESYCGAQGIMQLMPFTQESYGVTDPFDARQSIMAGAELLSELLDNYDGNATLALAAYNAGSGSVSRYGGVPPYDETLAYIDRINEFLDGALSNDSKSISDARSTDFSNTKNINVPDSSNLSNNTYVAPVFEEMVPDKIASSSRLGTRGNKPLLDISEYQYVINTLKEVFSKIIKINSNESDDNLSYKLYNELTRGSSTIKDLQEVRDSLKDTTKNFLAHGSGMSFNVAQINYNMLNSNTYDGMIRNDAQALFQAQASMASPLVQKLLDL